MQLLRPALITGIVAASAVTIAATIDTIDVEREDGVYSLHAVTRMAASPEAIREVLTDYDRFGRISSVYKDYGYLDPAPDGTPVVYTRMEGCILHIFCRSLKRVERLEENSPNYIRTVTLPEQSDFKRSESEWIIERDGDETRMTYNLVVEPDFWVPPLIGPAMLKRVLRRGGGEAVDRIESLAQAEEAGEGEQTVDTGATGAASATGQIEKTRATVAAWAAGD
jgi:hypothetical protein